jgi:hypothetical protein
MKRRAKVPEGYRRLRVGEIIREGDYSWDKSAPTVIIGHIALYGLSGLKVEKEDSNFYYRLKQTNKQIGLTA